MQVTKEKLQKFNAWGLVSVSGQEITIILTAVTTDGKPLSRTVKKESEHLLDFSGSALVAVDLNEKAQGIHEIGKTAIMGHPDVEKVFQDAVDWLRQTAN